MIDNNWFKSLVQSWIPNRQWQSNNLDTVCSLLAEISFLNGGAIIEDVQISENEKISHAVSCANDAIQRQINLYAEAGNDFQFDTFYGKEINSDSNDDLPFLISKQIDRKLDINRATLEQLDKLPGIGKVTGARIIDHRENVGRFLAIEEVQEIEGISKQGFEKFDQMIYVNSSSDKLTLRFELLDDFYSNPSFQNYIKLKMNGNATFLDNEDTNANIEERIVLELREIQYRLKVNPYPPRRILPYTRASSAKDEIAVRDLTKDIENKSIRNGSQGRILFSGQYKPFLEQMLGHCKESLYIIMFFLRFEDEKAYSTDSLINLVIQAHEQGADVKIILDIDEVDDLYHSQQINTEIFDYLTAKGVSILFDQPEVVTHSKIVIMDSRHVVVGSHNWTAGSFFQYHDISVYVDSTDLAKTYVQDFTMRWTELSQLDD